MHRKVGVWHKKVRVWDVAQEGKGVMCSTGR